MAATIVPAPACSNCKFLRVDECRLHPPLALRPKTIIGPLGVPVTDEAVLAIWPKVPPTGWCGDYIKL